MSGTIIHPTGTCFDDALDFLAEALRIDPRADLVLVHGICTHPDGPRAGTRYAHAWVEEGEDLWQTGIIDGERRTYCCERAEFYGLLKIVDTTRYTPRQADRENRRSNHYGPWVKRYAALCKPKAESDADERSQR